MTGRGRAAPPIVYPAFTAFCRQIVDGFRPWFSFGWALSPVLAVGAAHAMLTRGIFDSLAIWPAVFWPIVFSSCFYAYLRLCALLRDRYGASPLSGQGVTDHAVRYLALPAAIAVEIAAHGYLIYVIGPLYILVAIPIYILGWVLLPFILDGFRAGLSVLAMTHALFVAAFVVLLGFYDVTFLRALNSDLYALLTGVPTVL